MIHQLGSWLFWSRIGMPFNPVEFAILWPVKWYGPSNRKQKKQLLKNLCGVLRPSTHLQIAANRTGNIAINMASIFSMRCFVVKSDLALAHCFRCSNLCVVCVWVMYKLLVHVRPFVISSLDAAKVP